MKEKIMTLLLAAILTVLVVGCDNKQDLKDIEAREEESTKQLPESGFRPSPDRSWNEGGEVKPDEK
jgi:uncharacterized lipoprotein NlpE involved in copper resistance